METISNRNRLKVPRKVAPALASNSIYPIRDLSSPSLRQILVRPGRTVDIQEPDSRVDEPEEPVAGADAHTMEVNESRPAENQGDTEEEKEKTNRFFREDCFRHPCTRIGTCCVMLILELCFCIENPISRSHEEMSWAMVGPATNFLFRQWPMLDKLWLMATKVGMVTAFCFAAVVFARKHIHPFFADYLGLAMFQDNRGDLFCVTLVIIPALYVGAQAYNGVVWGAVETDVQAKYLLTDSLSTSNAQYYSHRQSLTWILCFLTLITVIDMLLQDRIHFKHWQEYRKYQWITAKEGFHRVLTVWLFAGAFSMLGFWIGDSWFALRSKKEDCIFGTNLFGTDEVSQISLFSWLFACRIIIIMQDYEFPQFGATDNVKMAGTLAQGKAVIYYLPGAKRMKEAAEAAAEQAALVLGEEDDGAQDSEAVNTPRLQAWWLHKNEEERKDEEEEGVVGGLTFQLHFDGKWVTYGPILAMLCLDAHTMYQLLEYSPEEYGQITDRPLDSPPEGRWRIYSLLGPNMRFGERRHIGGALWGWNAAEARSSFGDRAELGVYYRHSGTRERLLAAFPAGLSLFVFILAILRYNVRGYNDESEEDGDESESGKGGGADEEVEEEEM
jgi:hypothetical protein